MTPDEIGRAVGKSMDGLNVAVRRATREAMKDSGDLARTEITTEAIPVTGPDKRFSNFGRAGTLKVRLRQIPGGVRVSPQGPWGIAEKGAAPHQGSAWGRGKTKHPGTRAKQGRRAWTKGREATFRALDGQLPETVDRVMRQEFNRGS